jgi:hypothetical protein
MELRKRLEALRAMLSSWGLENAAVRDLTTLISVLKRFDELSLEEFCRLALRDKDENHAKRLQRAGTSSQPDEAMVSAYLDKLRKSLSDRGHFMSVASEMSADKKLKLTELHAVGNRLANIEPQKSKKQALEAIVSWAHRKFDTERRSRETTGLF